MKEEKGTPSINKNPTNPDKGLFFKEIVLLFLFLLIMRLSRRYQFKCGNTRAIWRNKTIREKKLNHFKSDGTFFAS